MREEADESHGAQQFAQRLILRMFLNPRIPEALGLKMPASLILPLTSGILVFSYSLLPINVG